MIHANTRPVRKLTAADLERKIGRIPAPLAGIRQAVATAERGNVHPLSRALVRPVLDIPPQLDVLAQTRSDIRVFPLRSTEPMGLDTVPDEPPPLWARPRASFTTHTARMPRPTPMPPARVESRITAAGHVAVVVVSLVILFGLGALHLIGRLA